MFSMPVDRLRVSWAPASGEVTDTEPFEPMVKVRSWVTLEKSRVSSLGRLDSLIV